MKIYFPSSIMYDPKIFVGLTIVIALALFLLPHVQPYIYLIFLLTLFLMLFPGFAVIQMLFPEDEISSLERAALSVSISLALIPLIGLTLNCTPLGIEKASAILSLFLLTMVSNALLIIKRTRIYASQSKKIKVNIKQIFCAFIPFAVAAILRVYPHLISGLPFSVDSWPSIRYAELLLEYSPVYLNDMEVFGSQHNYVGEKLFGAVVSAISGLQPIRSMALYVPLAGASSILVFYAATYRLYNEKGVPFLASLFLATSFSDVILTAGVKGETYAHPLYLTLILLYLNRDIAWWKKTLLFTLTSASLVLSHYFTAMLTVAILGSAILGSLVIGGKRGKNAEIRSLLLPTILALLILTYFLLYANWAFDFISAIDWLSAASYQTLTLSLALWLSFKPPIKKRLIIALVCIVALTLTLLFVWLTTVRAPIPGAPVLPARYIIYAGPFIAAAPLCILGYESIRKKHDERYVMPLFWLAAVLGLEGYAVFGSRDPSLSLTLAYRGINFLLPPVAILLAIGLHGLYEHWRLRKIAKAIIAIVMLLMLSLNIFGVYATIHLQERYMGYFWLYRVQEYRAARWVKTVLCDGTIACDVKIAYILKCYFNLRVDEFQGLRYLNGEGNQPRILFTYDQMIKNGYVMYGGYSVDLPFGWHEKTLNLNHIYSNGIADIYAG